MLDARLDGLLEERQTKPRFPSRELQSGDLVFFYNNVLGVLNTSFTGLVIDIIVDSSACDGVERVRPRVKWSDIDEISTPAMGSLVLVEDNVDRI